LVCQTDKGACRGCGWTQGVEDVDERTQAALCIQAQAEYAANAEADAAYARAQVRACAAVRVQLCVCGRGLVGSTWIK